MSQSLISPKRTVTNIEKTFLAHLYTCFLMRGVCEFVKLFLMAYILDKYALAHEADLSFLGKLARSAFFLSMDGNTFRAIIYRAFCRRDFCTLRVFFFFVFDPPPYVHVWPNGIDYSNAKRKIETTSEGEIAGVHLVWTAIFFLSRRVLPRKNAF